MHAFGNEKQCLNITWSSRGKEKRKNKEIEGHSQGVALLFQIWTVSNVEQNNIYSLVWNVEQNSRADFLPILSSICHLGCMTVSDGRWKSLARRVMETWRSRWPLGSQSSWIEYLAKSSAAKRRTDFLNNRRQGQAKACTTFCHPPGRGLHGLLFCLWIISSFVRATSSQDAARARNQRTMTWGCKWTALTISLQQGLGRGLHTWPTEGTHSVFHYLVSLDYNYSNSSSRWKGVFK